MTWALIHTSQNESEAIVIESVLSGAGIKYKRVRESIGKLYGITMNGLGEVKFYVKEEDAEEAKKILDVEDLKIPS